MKTPRLCCSHTLATDCVLYFYDPNADDYGSITIPAGTYWTDPIYPGYDVAPVPVDLIGKVSALLSGVVTVQFEYAASTVAGFTSLHCVTMAISGGSISFAWAPDGYTLTDDARHTMRRLGASPVHPGMPILTTATYGGLINGIWAPGRGPSVRLVERRADAPSRSIHSSVSGVAYPFGMGEPARTFGLAFSGLHERWVYSRGQGIELIKFLTYTPTAAKLDASFETLLWEWLARGEMVRYYEDTAAQSTYLAAACTATATSINIKSNTGLSNGDVIYVDGESMRIISRATASAVTVHRVSPVAHPIYAPISKEFVATYVLDDAGDVSLNSFAARSRGFTFDTYDLMIPLRRATWSG